MGGCLRPRRTLTETGSPACNLPRVGQNTPPLPPEGWYTSWNSRTFLITNARDEPAAVVTASSRVRGLDFAAALGMLAGGRDAFLLTLDFDYELPEGLIATHPAQVRDASQPVSYTHLRAHETRHDLVCRLL